MSKFKTPWADLLPKNPTKEQIERMVQGAQALAIADLEKEILDAVKKNEETAMRQLRVDIMVAKLRQSKKIKNQET